MSPMPSYALLMGGIWGGAWAAWWAYPALNETGLGGLSGVAHGLCGIVCLDLLRNPSALQSTRTIATAGFILLLGKCAWEAWTGHVVLEVFHAGDLGSPVAVAHAGGLLGAVLGDRANDTIHNGSRTG